MIFITLLVCNKRKYLLYYKHISWYYNIFIDFPQKETLFKNFSINSKNPNLDNVNLFKLRQLKVLENLLFINVSEPTLNVYFNDKCVLNEYKILFNVYLNVKCVLCVLAYTSVCWQYLWICCFKFNLGKLVNKTTAFTIEEHQFSFMKA